MSDGGNGSGAGHCKLRSVTQRERLYTSKGLVSKLSISAPNHKPRQRSLVLMSTQ